MSEATGVGFVPLELEEWLSGGNFEPWEAAALQFAVGVHDALVREDLTAREAFSALCGGRYRGACECKDGVPAGAEYVVCMSKKEADRCVPMAGPGVTPLLGFQPHGDLFRPLRCVERLAFAFCADEMDPFFNFCFEMFPELTSVDFSGVQGITVICDGFMKMCSGLRTFDFAPFKGVHKIRHQCLSNCSALSDVNLRGLEKVQTVNRGFMQMCKSLEALDLRPLRSLESIEDAFLVFTGLRALDLEPLHAIKHIPGGFLSYSDRLESLDFSPLTKVERIGKTFLKQCAGLRHVNLRGLENVRTVASGFFKGCTGIEALDLSPLQNVENIGSDAFSGCVKLRHIDFSHLCNVRHINLLGFLFGCDALSDESRASVEAFKEECRRRAANRPRVH